MTGRAAHEFEIVAAEPLPLQSVMRPEPAMRTLADYVRFLEAVGEIFGALPPNDPRVTRGDRFRL